MEKKRDITEKSKKNEILDAYNELLEQVKGEKTLDRKAEKKNEVKEKIVYDASQLSLEKIIKGLAEIKLEIGKTFDTLEEKLVAQYKKFTGLQEATAIEEKGLEELYEIKVNTDSLAALLLAQKEKKMAFENEMEQKKITFDTEMEKKTRDFETEMNDKKAQWKKEQEVFELAQKERGIQIKKDRQREEEEYTYTMNLSRKKDTDVYEAKKASLEKELNDKKESVEKELNEKKAFVDKDLAEREAAIVAQEKEFEELHSRVEGFPKQLEKGIKDAEKAIMEKLELKYSHESALMKKEIEGERKLFQQTIEALEAKIKTQNALIEQLTQKTNLAGQQVQDIAIKAIEGAAAQRIFTTSYERKADDATKSAS